MIKKILFYGNEMKYFIGLCEYINADSIGNPGKRTFKIVARSNSNNVTIWMEKESLFQIGISLAQFIATNTEPKNKDNFEDKNLVINNDIEFRSDDISLSHDSRADIFTIFSSGYIEDEYIDSSFSFSRNQAEKLSRKILDVVSSGRKPCFLCNVPLDPDNTHLCNKLNGYSVKSDSITK
ncbi:MAG: hypothetical protein CL778_02950 [Chloroflexi bacterium]|nr:hypothetical protein [Chloroflexota bacterium]|tara:strand:- start:26455 stop:26994 length:540 start_codon:yes stop_codon:yes gene_type:complete